MVKLNPKYIFFFSKWTAQCTSVGSKLKSGHDSWVYGGHYEYAREPKRLQSFPSVTFAKSNLTDKCNPLYLMVIVSVVWDNEPATRRD